MPRLTHLLLATVIAVAATYARADETKPAEGSAPAIGDLVKQLDAESFTDRQDASAKLAEMGEKAIDALGQAAQGESAEASTRALDILRKHHESSDAALRAAAKTALKKIADNDKGPASRRAAEILTPKTDPNTRVVPTPVPGGIRLGGAGGIRMEMRAIGGPGVRRISIKNTNGVKEIEAQEAERTVKISDDPDKGIKLKVTEKKDGKDETKEYEAKNAEELKAKHPEAHKIYEQYAAKGEGMRIELPAFGPAGVPGFAPAFPVPVLPAAPIRIARPVIVRDPAELADRFEKAQKELESATDRLKKIVESADNQAEVKKAIESLEQSSKELAELKAKLLP